MHVRLRFHGQPDAIIVVDSKLMKIEQFRCIINDKFDIKPQRQRLFYGGKLLEDGYTFHDYNIKLNDVIQLMVNPSLDFNTEKSESKNTRLDEKKTELKDGVSKLYAVGDLIDVRDKELGAWYEGTITRIVYNPKNIKIASPESEDSITENSDCVNKKPSKLPTSENGSSSHKKNTILEFFSKAQKKPKVIKHNQHTEDHLLFKIQFDDEKDDSDILCTLKDIRLRARKIIDVNDIVIGQTVMLNHNIEEPLEKGHWYDFKVDKINKNRKFDELVGTLYLGSDAVPQNDTTAMVHDKIFAIEDVIPVSERTEEYRNIITTPPEKRSTPIYCLTCRDKEDKPCKDCGCCLCSSKGNPDKIILCDECNDGYHMDCLTPPMKEVPDEDWYCPSCKRDPNDVVAPGSSKQVKKTSASKSKKDWGRGMACVGKTKTCPMPKNHFGPIPGIDVGMCWKFRIQLSESGVHRPPVSGIHGRDIDGAYSIVLSGGYEDDVDNGYEFTYTGSGGRDLSGNKRTAQQSCDQTLTRENKALARNCAVAKISEDGADAGDDWRNGKPVRVVRSYKMMKHFPMYAPKEGIRYDGIYKVVKYYPEKGLSGFRVWKYLLRRDDPCSAPWEPGAKQYPIVFPDGYLEAEAEKQSLKENKKRKAVNNLNTDSEDDAPALKKKKIKVDKPENPRKKGRPSKKERTPTSDKTLKVSKLENGDTKSMVHEMPSETIIEMIKDDTLNSKLWNECIEVCKCRGRKEFVDRVFEVFQCIICQELVSNPVTTSCLHNFCMDCMKLAFKCNTTRNCPYCRQDLTEFQLQQNTNNKLKAALQAILPGYDAGRK